MSKPVDTIVNLMKGYLSPDTLDILSKYINKAIHDAVMQDRQLQMNALTERLKIAALEVEQLQASIGTSIKEDDAPEEILTFKEYKAWRGQKIAATKQLLELKQAECRVIRKMRSEIHQSMQTKKQPIPSKVPKGSE